MSTANDHLRTQLAASWRHLLLPHGVSESAIAAAFTDLTVSYSDPARAYHNLTHLHEVLTIIDLLAAVARDLTAVRLAAWFHDAVYNPRAKDNEERSAELAADVLRGFGFAPDRIATVQRLIVLTKRHDAAADDTDGHVLLDADLAILGAESARYDDYARSIRREYAWVAENAYRAGRRAVLEGFLKRPHIYRTAPLCQTHECPARRNVQREIDLLRGGPGPTIIQVPAPP